jgi:hypothetical protein
MRCFFGNDKKNARIRLSMGAFGRPRPRVVASFQHHSGADFAYLASMGMLQKAHDFFVRGKVRS